MKKIFTILCLTLMAVSVNAQKLQVFKDGKLMAEFYEKDGWEFVFGNESTPSSGSDGYINGHEFVMIGGVKWATMNIGASTVAGSYNTCFGDYFTLGESTPRYKDVIRKSEKEVDVTWKYEYKELGYGNIDYDAKAGTEDAATVNWGAEWRTPTKEDFESLIQACGETLYSPYVKELNRPITEGGIYKLSASQTYEPDYSGVEGFLFVDKSNFRRRVFFPHAGYFMGAKYVDGLVSYWTTTKNEKYESSDHFFCFFGERLIDLSYENLDHGLSIRPVAK